MNTKLELQGEEFDLSSHYDCEQGYVVRVSACEVKVVQIVHHCEYLGPGKPLKKWDTEHLLLDISGEGIEVIQDNSK